MAEINEVAATSGDELCALFVVFPVPFASREDLVAAGAAREPAGRQVLLDAGVDGSVAWFAAKYASGP